MRSTRRRPAPRSGRPSASLMEKSGSGSRLETRRADRDRRPAAKGSAPAGRRGASGLASCRARLADERRLHVGADRRRRLGGLLLLRRVDVEEVADALEGPDPARLARRGAELATDAADPDAEVLEIVAVFRTPDLREELGVEHDLAGVRREMLQEQPLGPRQLDQLAVAGDHPPLEIDLDVVELDDAGAGLGPARPADDRPDSGSQLV